MTPALRSLAIRYEQEYALPQLCIIDFIETLEASGWKLEPAAGERS